MDPLGRRAEAVVVRDGRIAAGGERAVLAAYPEAEVVELADRTLLPGFIDADDHLCIAALHPRWSDPTDASLEQVDTPLARPS